jgi:flagellar hook protein FlgE
MGFFGALYTGTAGLLAQERSTAVTSENIANSTTTGYKRQDVAFSELVNTNKSTTSRSGGVSSQRLNQITLQGGISQSSSGTDVAITGNGFFAVRAPGADPESNFLYTRNGSFQPDSQGILRNSAGFSLYGWPIVNGATVSGTTTDSLQEVDVDILQTQSLPTTFATISLNLDANETPVNPRQLTPPQDLPVNSVAAAPFTRGLIVYDSNGAERRLNFEFRPVTGPMAHFGSQTAVGTNGLDRTDILADITGTGPTPSILDGDILQVNDGTNTLNVTFRSGVADPALNEASSVGDMINLLNNFTDAGGQNPFTATIDDSGQLLVQANDPTVTLDITGSSATVLGAGGLNIIQDPDGVPDYTYEPQASLTANGVANPNQTNFPTFADAARPNPFHWWEVTTTIADPANPTGSAQIELSKGLLNFDDTGSLNAALDADGQAILSLGNINFDNATAGEETSIDINIGRFTQFGGNYDVIFEEQNGAELGTFTGTQITREGIVQSVFSNGQIVDSYQIPLARFVNANGLERISGTAFAVTENSGDVELFDPGAGGTGFLSVSALETSNVDIAEEFSELIVSQRAFSMNSRVITTVDELTENLVQLKR